MTSCPLPLFHLPHRPSLVVVGIALLSVGFAGMRPSCANPTRPIGVPSVTPLSGQAVAFALRYGPPPEPSDSPDRWWARDKARHVAFSALWTLSAQYVLVSKADWSEGDALPVSIGSAAVAGLAKELYDRRTPEGRFSARDLVANTLGIGLAAGLISL